MLHELLLFVNEVLWDTRLVCSIGPHRELVLNLSTLLLGPWIGLNVVLAHEIEQLSWDLFKDLLCKQVRVVLEVVEGHKLHDVSSHVLAEGL